MIKGHFTKVYFFWGCTYKNFPVFCQYDSAVGYVHFSLHTDGCKYLHTLLIKYYNDLLDRQNSERGWDEVTYFYDWDGFRIHLRTR